MEKAPGGTSVGVDDPYAYVDRCDHVTDEGNCRWAVDHGHHDPAFADERSAEGFRCPVARETPRAPENGSESGATREPGDATAESISERASGNEVTREHADPGEEGLTGPWEWTDCPHFRCRNRDRECVRCGLEVRRMAHTDERPLLEEHHLSYTEGSDAGDGEPSHEITVFLCRWCHAKVHNSWARIDDDAGPDPEAIAEHEGRRSREFDELSFESAAERYEE